MNNERTSDWRAVKRWTWIVALAGAVLAGCNRAPRPDIKHEWTQAPYEFCIGIYTGATPVSVAPIVGLPQAPVFTAADVPYVPARFVADPFVVRRDGTWYLFFELLNAATGQGDIGLATSSDGRHWEFAATVLDEPFHLSYPFVFEWNGAWYMLPEGAKSGALTLYRAIDFPRRWEPDAKLLDGAYVDTTLLNYAGRWWMFTTPHGTGDLLLFMADNLRGPWITHPASPIVRNNDHISRCGGRIVVNNGTPLRFAQDDKPTYGNALRAFRITKLTPSEYAEEPATSDPILAATGEGWRAWGMHHIDPLEVHPDHWLAMVDGLGSALPDIPLKVEFANGVRLDGIDIRPGHAIAGGTVLIRDFWSGMSAVPTNKLAAFVHLQPRGYNPIFQGDTILNATQDFYEAVVRIPSSAPPGWYELEMGVYSLDTGKRVALKYGEKRDKAFRIHGVLQVSRP